LASKVAENEASNRMSLENVADIMMPNLFVPPQNMPDMTGISDAKGMAAAMGFNSSTLKLTMLMIVYRSILEVVPQFISGQLSNKESKNGKMTVRIDAPQFALTSVMIPVTPSTTVGDVVEQVCKIANEKRPTDFVSHLPTKPRYGPLIP